jgi:hypothetical protein
MSILDQRRNREGFASLTPCSRQMSATLVPPSAWRKARKICSSVRPFFATCVSSSCSSTGSRLPLQTQLIAGSLFGFWLNLGPCGKSVYSNQHHRRPTPRGCRQPDRTMGARDQAPPELRSHGSCGVLSTIRCGSTAHCVTAHRRSSRRNGERPRCPVRNQFRTDEKARNGQFTGDTHLSLLRAENAGQTGLNRITQAEFSTSTWYAFAGQVKTNRLYFMNRGKLGSRPGPKWPVGGAQRLYT